MADTVTKILIRQGTDVQRRTAEGTGVIFSSGEPGYTVDTKRLFIGDGSTSGGNPIGIANLGLVTTLYGTWQNGLSFDAITRFNSKGASVGDIIYDAETRGIYALTSVTAFPPLSSDLIKLDTATLINNTQFEYTEDRRLQIKQGGVGNNQLALNIVDGVTLFKGTYASPMSVKTNSLTNQYLAPMPSQTLKVNNTAVSNNPSDLYVGPGQVVGRTATGSLTAFEFSVILAEADFDYQNGIIVDQTVNPPVFKLDPNIFTATSGLIELRKPTTVFSGMTVNGTLQVNGVIRSTSDITAYYFPSDRNFKKNLKSLETPLEKILKLNAYSFEWDSDALENTDYDILVGNDVGVIAQEVEQIIPELVITRDSGSKSVSYIKLVPYLIESIKDLQKQINELKKSGCNC